MKREDATLLLAVGFLALLGPSPSPASSHTYCSGIAPAQTSCTRTYTANRDQAPTVVAGFYVPPNWVGFVGSVTSTISTSTASKSVTCSVSIAFPGPYSPTRFTSLTCGGVTGTGTISAGEVVTVTGSVSTGSVGSWAAGGRGSM